MYKKTSVSRELFEFEGCSWRTCACNHIAPHYLQDAGFSGCTDREAPAASDTLYSPMLRHVSHPRGSAREMFYTGTMQPAARLRRCCCIVSTLMLVPASVIRRRNARRSSCATTMTPALTGCASMVVKLCKTSQHISGRASSSSLAEPSKIQWLGNPKPWSSGRASMVLKSFMPCGFIAFL